MIKIKKAHHKYLLCIRMNVRYVRNSNINLIIDFTRGGSHRIKCIPVSDTESWHLLSQGRTLPPARHKHSAIIHDDVMWVYGGMTDLNERSDLWRFDFG